MSGRDHILGSIRSSLGRGPLSAAASARLDEGMANPKPAVVPERARLSHDRQVALFIAMAQEVSATVDRVPSPDAVPQAVAEYLAGQNLPTRMAAAPALRDIDWSKAPLLDLRFGPADPGDLVSVTPAFAAIAETGTLALLSGPDSPTSLNFLPDNHIAVVRASDVVGGYEDVFAKLRARGLPPRTLNMITGPSRTGDIEQTIQLGAHGPRRLHIVLIDDAT